MRKKKEKRGVGCCFSIEKRLRDDQPQAHNTLGIGWTSILFKDVMWSPCRRHYLQRAAHAHLPNPEKMFFFSLCLTFPKRITSVIFVCVCVCVFLWDFFFFFSSRISQSTGHLASSSAISRTHLFDVCAEPFVCDVCVRTFRRPKRKWEKHLGTFEVFFFENRKLDSIV